MNQPAVLIAHPFPIVVDALAALMTAAGYTVTRANDETATAAALGEAPALALVATAFERVAVQHQRNDATRTIALVDGDPLAGAAAIPLTAPVAALSAAIRAVAGDDVPAARGPALTTRERDVARLVAAGRRNRAIAVALGISEGTVKMHLHNVYTKLNLESRTQLAIVAAGLTA